MTWLPLESTSKSERDAVLALQLEVSSGLLEMLELSWAITDPDLLEPCRLQMARIMGCRAVLEVADRGRLAELENCQSSAGFSDDERAALAYAEQFVTDQNGITNELNNEVMRHLSRAELLNFVQALNVYDGYLRFMTLLDVGPDEGGDDNSSKPEPSPRRSPVTEGADGQSARGLELVAALTDPAFADARVAFGAATALLSGVDDVTSECCRLRNASHQGCHFCMSTRCDVAPPSDVEDLMSTVLTYEDSVLSERQKVALRLTDAFITQPARFGAASQGEALEHFEPRQIVELLLKLVAWTANKTGTALKMDEPIDADRLTSFHYDSTGRHVYHLTGQA